MIWSPFVTFFRLAIGGCVLFVGWLVRDSFNTSKET